jgi:hypothetical protein
MSAESRYNGRRRNESPSNESVRVPIVLNRCVVTPSADGVVLARAVLNHKVCELVKR